jgi:hypothetical protein
MHFAKLFLLFSALAVTVAVASPQPDDGDAGEAPAPTVEFVADTEGGKGGKYGNYAGHSPYGYEKPNFEYPSLKDRFKHKCRSVKAAIVSFFGKIGSAISAVFHKIKRGIRRKWRMCKSDAQRFKYWWHCKKAEFKRYMYYRKQLAMNRKIKLSKRRMERLANFIDYCEQKRDEYAYKARECKESYPDHTHPVPDYDCDAKEPEYTPPKHCPKAVDPEPY